jgi:hypothetical protein
MAYLQTGALPVELFNMPVQFMTETGKMLIRCSGKGFSHGIAAPNGPLFFFKQLLNEKESRGGVLCD